MGKLLVHILENFPVLEVWIRCFLWRFPRIKAKIAKMHSENKQGKHMETDYSIWEDIKKEIESYGIKNGDILLVHSSMDGLAKTGVSPTEVIDFLLNCVGDEGTLVFASYPKCKPFNGNADVLLYDPKRTVSWTGLLPNVFCKYEGVVRSEYPYNTLAAKGKHAEDMMKDNLMDDVSQGQHSAWKYCVDHHAKILYLGVSAALSCTMMNYPEDALGEQWYVDHWYHTQKYVIKSHGELIEKEIRERDSEWYRYYAMFHSEVWLKKNGFLKSREYKGVYVGFTENMFELAEKLLGMGLMKKSVYRIPKRYWKKEKDV